MTTPVIGSPLKEIIAYRGTHKQVWNNTNITGPWLNLMRNSINAQIFSFGHKDFLTVSATHGTAHLALLDQAMWDKYELAASDPNTLLESSRCVDEMVGELGGRETSWYRLGQACHNAIWEVTAKLPAATPGSCWIERTNAAFKFVEVNDGGTRASPSRGPWAQRNSRSRR